ATSGHAAALPSSVMNSRRLMCTLARLKAAHYHAIKEERRCASQQKLRVDVADGSIASHRGVRNAPGMSAMPPIATQSVRRNEASRCATSGCEQPQQNSRVIRSLDHLIGAGKQHPWDNDVESFRRLEIDHEFEFRRRPNGKIRRLRTAKDA